VSVDISNYRRLLQAILMHAMDDYTKLQHPKNRRKKYLDKAFSSAVDMFFDSDYMMLHLQNGDGSFMSLKDFLMEALDTENVDVEKIKSHVVQNSRAFWETKMLNTVYIPDNIVYDGHAYRVIHSQDRSDPVIDFDEKCIFLNKDYKDSENQQKFILTLVRIVIYHEDIAVSQSKIETIGRGMFKLLRMNGCFISD
jgi:hypothetical protein